jgi:surfactin synthase thioesterase subunit
MMAQLARHAAEIAQRLAVLPGEGSHDHAQALDSIERLASQILKEVSAARAAKPRALGESRGAWRAIRPIGR